MYEINCFKEDSYTLTRLTQWDTGQYISIKKEDIEAEIDKIRNILDTNEEDLYSKLEFNFFNKISNISVIPVIDENNITVLIPDRLLQEPYPIISYIYFNSDTYKKVIVNIKIPVTPRQKPDDYKEYSVGTSNPSVMSLSFNGIIGKAGDIDYIPLNGWNYWQETNDDTKITATVTASPTADCLLLACVMHRDSDISISDDGWQKIVTSPVMVSDTTNQYVSVWGKRAKKGTYEVTTTQTNSVRMSLKIIALYDTESVRIVENTLIDTFPVVPAENTGTARRLYLLSSIFANATGSDKAITADKGNLDLSCAEELRFSVFYSYETDKAEVPVFNTSIVDFTPNTANMITLEIEEK